MNFPIPAATDDRDRANLASRVDYPGVESFPEIWPIAAKKFADIVALRDPHSKPEAKLTFSQLYQNIRQFAAGMQALGVRWDGTGDPPRVALFSDNSPRWMVADQGIMMAGGADAVRSSQADRDESIYILQNSESVGLVVEDIKTLKKLQSSDEFAGLPLQWVVLLSDEEPPKDSAIEILNYSQLMERGSQTELETPPSKGDTLATLLYTSGTTGKPKGVYITHANLLYQIATIPTIVQPEPGDRFLSILPTWHTFGRTIEYFGLSQGWTQIYTSIRYFKRDLTEFKPHYMVGVPRIWEAIYEGIRKQLRDQPENKQKLANFFLSNSEKYIKYRRICQGLNPDLNPISGGQKLVARTKMSLLAPIHQLGDRAVYRKMREAAFGGNIKGLVSGGGSLAMHVEDFYEIINIPLLVGYGLTETSPVLSARRDWHNLKGSSGKPLPGTELKIVDPETRTPLKAGEKGAILARGPQIMTGYFRNPEATQKAIDSEGWFDTGDLGLLSTDNDLFITGRSKDTIVLTNGENIEPQPIEDACVRSAYIDQMMLVGQDRKQLGALIVPDLDALQKWAQGEKLYLNVPDVPPNDGNLPKVDLDDKRVRDLFRKELDREVRDRPGFRGDDRIGPFALLREPFTIDNGMLTQTLKMKRPVITERYRDTIESIYE